MPSVCHLWPFRRCPDPMSDMQPGYPTLASAVSVEARLTRHLQQRLASSASICFLSDHRRLLRSAHLCPPVTFMSSLHTHNHLCLLKTPRTNFPHSLCLVSSQVCVYEKTAPCYCHLLAPTSSECIVSGSLLFFTDPSPVPQNKQGDNKC